MTLNIRNKQVKAVFAVVILFFLLFIIIPAFMILKNSFTAGGTFSFSNFAAVFSEGKLAKAFWNSTKVSFLSSVLTTVLAFILAYTVCFTNIPDWLKKTIRTLAVFPMLLPTITYGFAVIYSFGKTGLLTRLFGKQFFDFYGFKGLVFCYVVYTLPISFTLIKNTMGYIDRRFIVVCRVMGDNTFKTMYTAIIRPLWSTLAVSLVQSFFLSFTDFGVPASIGGRYTVVAELLYNTMLGALPDFNQGSVIALMMLLPSIVSVLLLNYLQKFNVRYSKISKDPMNTNYARDIILTIFTIVILVLMLSIFAVVFIAPFATEWPYNLNFTLSNVKSLFSDKALVKVFTNSLWISFLSALFGTILVYASSLIAARSKHLVKGTRIIEVIAQITNTIPGMVLGIAFLLAFRKTFLHNTVAIIVCCNLIHFFATPFLMMKETMNKMNASWETTASIMGDSWIKTVIRVITPNALPTLMESFIYLFINGMVTVSAVVFISGARTMVITTKIQELQHFAKFNEIFILSILIFITNLIMKSIKGVLNNKFNK